MPQSPFLVDRIQIEPGSGDTLTVSRDSADGSMAFLDALVSARLSDLVGIRNVTGLYVVGRDGDGAPYKSIQSAIEAIPASSSASAPSLVLVLPGLYAENLKIQKDGVCLVGLGGVVITNDGASDTVEISAAIATTPQDVLVRGITIRNTSVSGSCIRIMGADSFASGSVTVNTAPLATGDTLTIGGIALTGTAGTRTSGSNNFSVSGMTADAIAVEIAAAINDPANSFAVLVEAEAALNVVAITAVTAGSGGNAITMAVSTTPLGGITLSGANLTGGGAAGTLVGDGSITIENCDIVASGAAAYQVRADTSGHIRVRGGTWRGSDSASLSTAFNCALFSVVGVEWMNDIEVAYDTIADRPNDITCEYLLSDISRAGGVLANLSGAGSLTISGCPSMGTLAQAGDQTLSVRHSSVGAVTLSDTVAATFLASTRTTATVVGGTPTLYEEKIKGVLSFSASNSEAYAFDVTQPDTGYVVLVESPSAASTLAISNKTVNGFEVLTDGTLITGDVGIIITR